MTSSRKRIPVGAAVAVDRTCDVRAGSPHGCEGVSEVGLVVNGGQAPDAFGGDGLVGGVGAGEVHDVFEVQVPGGLSGGVVDAVAGVAGGRDGALQVVGGASVARATTSAIGTSTAEIFLVVNSNAAASAPVPELQHHLDTYSLDGPDGLVFVNEHGHPWHRGNFNPAVRWRDAREQIGIPNLHLHDLPAAALIYQQ